MERLTGADGPTGRVRLERELGLDLAELLVGALARPGFSEDWPICPPSRA